jgi:hypothetical protein
MALSDKQVEEFRRLVELEFGEAMTFDEARAEAENYVNLLLLVSRKRPRDTRGT